MALPCLHWCLQRNVPDISRTYRCQSNYWPCSSRPIVTALRPPDDPASFAGEYQHWRQEPTAGTNDCNSGFPLPTCHLPNLTYPFGNNDRSVDICFSRFVHIPHFTSSVSIVLLQLFVSREQLIHLGSVETNSSRDVCALRDTNTQILMTCEESTQPVKPSHLVLV